MTEESDREYLIYIAAQMPLLIIKLSLTYLRMKRRGKKAGKEFQASLLRQGVPSAQARALTDEYTSMVSVSKLVKETTDMDLPFL